MFNIKNSNYAFLFDISDKNSFPRIRKLRKQKYEISNALSVLKINESNGFRVIIKSKIYYFQLDNDKLKWLEISNVNHHIDKFMVVFADGYGYKANYDMHISISDHLYPSNSRYWSEFVVFFHDKRNNAKYVQYFNNNMTAKFDNNDILVNIYDNNNNIIYKR